MTDNEMTQRRDMIRAALERAEQALRDVEWLATGLPGTSSVGQQARIARMGTELAVVQNVQEGRRGEI